MSSILPKSVGKVLLGAKKSHLFARNAKRFWHIHSGTLGSFVQQFTAEKHGKYGLLDCQQGSGERQLYQPLTRHKQLQREGGIGYNCKSTLYNTVRQRLPNRKNTLLIIHHIWLVWIVKNKRFLLKSWFILVLNDYVKYFAKIGRESTFRGEKIACICA